MKWVYWALGGLMLAAVLIVLFVPGLRENIEGQVLSRLARWSR